MGSNQNNLSRDMINNKRITFLLNGVQQQLTVIPGMTLLEMLHDGLNLYGTKLTCNEGDCGACTVIIGKRQSETAIKEGDEPSRAEVSYQAVNSCIYPAVRIHNKHLITIEGVGEPDDLHPVQKALLDYHGTQCGYCTPGFVMAIIALFMNNPRPAKADILASLEGNLCRCTGYDAIMQAVIHLKAKLKTGESLLPGRLTVVENKIGQLSGSIDNIPRDNRELLSTFDYLKPHSVEELTGMLKTFEDRGDYAFVNGATDLLVQANVSRIYHSRLIDIAEIPGLNYIIRDEEKLRIGATTSLTEIERSALIREHIPVLAKIISLMASSQIRNTATIGGNIGNASPVADTPPVLLVLDAGLELTSPAGKRTVKLSDYYLDYKKTVLKNQEFISGIFLPLSDSRSRSNEESGEILFSGSSGFCYQDMLKAAKRRAVDISTVNSAISLQVVDGICKDVRLAFGGVAAYPALAMKTMSLLEGREIEPDRFEDIAEQAVNEFKPISDIRGRDIYRQTLIRNHTLTYLNNIYEMTDKSMS